MAATDPLTEADLDSAFESSPEFGIQCLDSDFRERILRYITRVGRCFIDNYEDFRARDTYRPLAEAVSAITHVTESVAAVKSEWRYAREKIIAELNRRGYTYITVE